MVDAQRAVLASSRQPFLSFEFVNNAWGYNHVSCLIGAGEIYEYDYQLSEEVLQISKVDTVAYKRALELANGLKGRKYLTDGVMMHDAGKASWVVTRPDRSIPQKSAGTEGAVLDDPDARELVKFINKGVQALLAVTERIRR